MTGTKATSHLAQKQNLRFTIYDSLFTIYDLRFTIVTTLPADVISYSPRCLVYYLTFTMIEFHWLVERKLHIASST